MGRQQARRFEHGWWPVLTAALSTLTIAVAWSATPAGAAGAKASSWKAYFLPAVVGYHCNDVIAANAAGTTGTETLTVSAVTSAHNTTRYTVTESGTTTAKGRVVPTQETLHYAITGGGQLEYLPSTINIGSASGGLSGVTNLGTVSNLTAGHATTSVLHIVEPLAASELKDLKGIITPGQTSLHATLTMVTRGTPVTTLTVPLGTLHHLIKVKAAVSHIAFTNVVPGASSALARDVRSEFESLLNFSTWYAPGIGPVQVDTGGLTVAASACAN